MESVAGLAYRGLQVRRSGFKVMELQCNSMIAYRGLQSMELKSTRSEGGYKINASTTKSRSSHLNAERVQKVKG